MSTWVEPSKRNNHWYLFNNLYLVRVNELAIRPIEHIKEFGVLVSGNKDFDRGIEKREITCMMKIPDIAEHHFNGIGIYLVNGSDSKEISEIIEKHLSTWVEYLNREFSVGDAPIEDLQKLDRLANTLYPIRQRNTAPGEATTSFEKALQKVLGNRKIMRLKQATEKKNEETEEPKRSATLGKLLQEFKTTQDYRRM